MKRFIQEWLCLATVEDAYREHIRMLKELDESARVINMLRQQPSIAREAIERFCPPENSAAAECWLRRKGL